MKRLGVVLGIVVLAMGSLVTVYRAGQRTAGPDPAGPVEPPPLTVAVERASLRDTVVLAGGEVRPLGPSFAVVDRTVGAPPVVTAEVPDGRLAPGDVLIEVSRRPVLLFSGDVPAYRDLSLGVSGPDVIAIQTTLVDLDLLDEATGTFDESTATAVARLYQTVEYEPPPPMTLPLAEMAIVPGRSWTVTHSDQHLGADPVTPLAELAAGQAAVHAVTDPDTAETLKVGMTSLVTIGTSVVAGEVLDMTIPEEGEDAPASVIIGLPEDNQTLTSGAVADVEIVRQEETEKQLIVPVTALSMSPGGADLVTVALRDGTHEDIAVNVEAVVGGAASISVLEGNLAAGDRVVVSPGE